MNLSFRACVASALSLLGIVCTLSVVQPAHAQERSHSASGMDQVPTPEAGMVPPSICTADWPTAKPGKGKSIPAPVSQQAVADAVLGETCRNLWEMIDLHFHKGEYNHCVNLSKLIVQGDPRNVEAYSNAAWLLWSTDRNDEALAFLKQGIKANPDNYYMYDETGSEYSSRMKDYTSALPYYEKAVQFKCPFSTWHALAHCYEHTNQWDKALHAWETATKYPEDRLAPARLRRLRAEIAKRKGN